MHLPFVINKMICEGHVTLGLTRGPHICCKANCVFVGTLITYKIFPSLFCMCKIMHINDVILIVFLVHILKRDWIYLTNFQNTTRFLIHNDREISLSYFNILQVHG